MACIEGWKLANGGEDKPPTMDPDEFDAAVAGIEKGKQ